MNEARNMAAFDLGEDESVSDVVNFTDRKRVLNDDSNTTN